MYCSTHATCVTCHTKRFERTTRALLLVFSCKCRFLQCRCLRPSLKARSLRVCGLKHRVGHTQHEQQGWSFVKRHQILALALLCSIDPRVAHNVLSLKHCFGAELNNLLQCVLWSVETRICFPYMIRVRVGELRSEDFENRFLLR